VKNYSWWGRFTFPKKNQIFGNVLHPITDIELREYLSWGKYFTLSRKRQL